MYACGNCYAENFLILPWLVFAFAAGNPDCGLRAPSVAVPGALISGYAVPGSKLVFSGKRLHLAADGRWVAGIGRDAQGSQTVSVTSKKCRAQRLIRLTERAWRTERVSGVPQNTVTPDPVSAKRIAAESALIVAARSLASARTDWASGFIWPARGRISGVYGSQRILNGTPSSPHLGLDIAAARGTPVYASAAGRVSLSHQDMLLTGKTVLIDHGHGVSTIYIHLDQIHVLSGQDVRSGQALGSIGTTGRSTGPHLHFQLHWFQEKLDPALVLPALNSR